MKKLWERICLVFRKKDVGKERIEEVRKVIKKMKTKPKTKSKRRKKS